MNQNNEQLRDTAAAYVLGALPEIEIQAFRREIMRDEELGRYVESLQAVGDVLLASAPPVEVPDSLGAAIMAEARRDQEVAELVTSPRAGQSAGQSAPAKSRGRLGRWLLRPAVGFAAAALLIVGAFAIGQGSDNGGSTPPATSAAVAFAPGVGTDTAGKVLPIGDGTKGAVVKLNNLNPNIGSDVYELWIAHGNKISRSSLFSVRANGTGISAIPEDISSADAIMVTREPAGGTDQPSGPVLAIAKLS
jgi:anti-sigma-K factor RskA